MPIVVVSVVAVMAVAAVTAIVKKHFTFLFGMMLYPAASVATLNSSLFTLLASLIVGVIGTVVIGGVLRFILNQRDLA